ncbi:hypothetical protein Ddc_09897 [Ditylenchus destructor]|nr:hypothetical protein Ddc_09897 [Ditylenchus destructor]
MFPLYALHEAFCFYGRDRLERISICNRQFNQIVAKYFSSRPYRYLTLLNVNCVIDKSEAKVTLSPEDFAYKIPKEVRDSLESDDEDEYEINLSKMLPLLRNRSIRVGLAWLYLSPRTFHNVKEHLESISHIWQNSSLIVYVDRFHLPQMDYEPFFQEVLSSKSLMKSAQIGFGLDSATDFLHSIPFHRQKQLVIKFSFNSWEQTKNNDKHEAIVRNCERRFIDATTQLSYKAVFEFSYSVDGKSKIFSAKNTKTREQLQLTVEEGKEDTDFYLCRTPL